MNVTCRECASIFRVDPAKVPAAGVRARCSVCGAVIPVAGPGAAVAPTPAASAPVVAPPAPAAVLPSVEPPVAVDPAFASAAATPIVAPPVAPPAPADSVTATTPAIEVGGDAAGRVGPRIAPRAEPGRESADDRAAAGASAPRAAAGPTPPAVPAPTAGPSGPRRFNPYLSNDPSQKARRLARALVSDIVAYQPQKREEGLRAGTLKELFRDEIRKSWEEYVAQVGAPLAESTTHFQDALNDVLAGGRKMF